jgi:hypothetical protein
MVSILSTSPVANRKNEIEAAALNYIYQDQQERELEYEPDYGND